MLARLVLCLLVGLAASACGSRVAYQSAAPAVGSGSVASVHADTPPGRPPADFGAVIPPELPPAPEQVQPPAEPPHRETQALAPETAISSPGPAPHQRPKSTGGCDWHGNLEQATAGRPIDWIILDTGAWGRAEVPGTRIWIAPRTPCDKVYSVAVHEWTHHMQGVVYGDWGVVMRELAPYGGPEVVADCGALLLAATWIKYGCTSQESSEAAAAILQGLRPPARDNG